MWESRAGPRRRLVFAKEMFRTAWNVVDYWRVDVTVAQLRADHLIGLALFDIGHAREIVPRRLTGRARLPYLRTPLRTPLAAAKRRVPGCAHIAFADLAPLDFIGAQQVGAAPTLEG